MTLVHGMPVENANLFENIMAEPAAYKLIEVAGEDAKTFLFGLTTSDVKQVSATYSQFSSMCDVKGRVLASFLIFKRYDACYLYLPAEMVAPVINKLKLHILRAKVALSAIDDSLKVLGLAGADSTQNLAQALGTSLDASSPGAVVQSGDYTVILMPGQIQPRWLVVSSAAAITELSEKLAAQFSVNPEAWSVLDAISGLPFITPGTAGNYLPQSLNLEALGGLSFTKGCYPGQEVVARRHYRGKLTRKLYVAYADTPAVPEIGAPLYRPGNPEAIGSVVSAARHSDGPVALQAVIEIEEQNQGEVMLTSPGESKLVFMAEI
ncbi:MAG: folate-binding protein [Methylococcaceae bacterium]|jgi:folate-binding protein YgfZ